MALFDEDFGMLRGVRSADVRAIDEDIENVLDNTTVRYLHPY